MLFILERTFEINYPRVLGLDQDFPLSFDMTDLVLVQHFRFLHLLHRYDLTCFLKLADANLTKGSSTYNAQRLEVSQRNLLSPMKYK